MLDQDEALAFYVGKLGLEVHTDTGRGVEITDDPSDKGYGIDFGIRDRFGNRIRIAQLHEA